MTANDGIWPVVGSWGAYVVAFAFAAYYIAKAIRGARKSGQESRSAPVMDASAANTALVNTLAVTQRALRQERTANREKDERIDALESRCEDLRRQIIQQRVDYDAQIRAAREEADRQIRDMQEQVNRLTFQLGDLRRRLGTDLDGGSTE